MAGRHFSPPLTRRSRTSAASACSSIGAWSTRRRTRRTTSTRASVLREPTAPCGSSSDSPSARGGLTGRHALAAPVADIAGLSEAQRNKETQDMDDVDLPTKAGGLGWWEDPDPKRAHLKYLKMHSSPTNRCKLVITERLMNRFDWAGKSVLEYGCGGGYFTVWMARRGARVTAIEMSPCAIGAVNYYAAQEGVADRVQVVPGNAEQDAVPGQYDFIFAKDLVEHLEDDGAFFRRLAQQLRPGGGT